MLQHYSPNLLLFCISDLLQNNYNLLDYYLDTLASADVFESMYFIKI